MSEFVKQHAPKTARSQNDTTSRSNLRQNFAAELCGRPSLPYSNTPNSDICLIAQSTKMGIFCRRRALSYRKAFVSASTRFVSPGVGCCQCSNTGQSFSLEQDFLVATDLLVR
eukprot:4953699-Amphidinium_carterae.1